LGDGRRRAEAIGEMRSISNGHEYKNAFFEIGAGLAAGMCIGDTVGKEILRSGKEPLMEGHSNIVLARKFTQNWDSLILVSSCHCAVVESFHP
jgi:hypothetical protein